MSILNDSTQAEANDRCHPEAHLALSLTSWLIAFLA